MAVVRAVADAEETAPADLSSLYDVVDPDALDAIFQRQASGSVLFEYCDYTVAVQSNDLVVLRK